MIELMFSFAHTLLLVSMIFVIPILNYFVEVAYMVGIINENLIDTI
jgi:hypothetical protein